jgi:penicillin-binding protein 1C
VPVSQPKRKKRRRARLTVGCVARTVGLALLGGFVAFMLLGGAAAIYYSQETAPTFRDINDISDLQEQALQFETTRIRDRDGNILYQINDPEGGFRDYVELEDVSPWVIYATVATEEREYFTNPGFSIPAIIRAVIQNVREGAAVSGASTITQQLTRALLLPEEERTERTVRRKIKEIFLAAELGRRFSKEEILELYLNQIYYGNLAYGIESASQLYFDKPASELNAAEAAMLAGIPQAPAVWDPVSAPEDAYFRMEQQVLPLMLVAGEQGGIDTGRTDIQLPVFTDQELVQALQYIEEGFPEEFEAPDFAAEYPHWVVYITQQLESDEAIQSSIYTSGYDVYTTLDPRVQDVAQARVETTLAGLVDRNVSNASVVVIDANTGAILAMVGSRDFDDESIDGQVNVALTPQQPGSSIKPFTYLTAFREGWGPGSVIWDVPIQYEISGFGVYEPTNYGDSGFAGPVSARYALANSLNVPAVLTVDFVGVEDLLQTLNDVGVESLGTAENEFGYGLSLTLGAGEVNLVEWTNAYAVLANGGTLRPTYAIERIELNGEVIQEYEVPEGEQVLDPDNLYLLQSILTDYQARVPAFGSNSPLSPPGYVAGAKTGTTNDFRDNWTMGFTTELATGVWVGNTDNSPMLNVTGVTGAGPIWRGVMDAAQQWYPSGQFQQPPGVQRYEICRDDGARPSEFCEEIGRTTEEIYDVDTPPLPAEEAGLYRELEIDTFTGLIANEFCDQYTREELFLVIPNPSQLIDVPAFAYDWLLNNDRGRAWANGRNIDFNQFSAEPPPDQACDPNTPRPEVAITTPNANTVQEGIILVEGSAAAPNFDYYFVDFGLSEDPEGWTPVQGRTDVEVRDGVLGQFDLSPFVGEAQTTATIRVVVVDVEGNRAEQRVTFQIAQATPTPTPTITPTPEEEEDEPTATPTLGLAPVTTPTPTEEGS